MTKIFAHRGASGYEPENTLKAFQAAYEQGADGIELDVQLSKDGKIMIMHDEKLNRVTGKKGWLKDFMAADLARMAVRSGMLNNSGKIPSLEEVLKWAKPLKIEINIEFKTGVIAYSGIEEKVIEMVKKMGMEKRVIYSSFNHYSIKRTLELAPEAKTGLLIRDVFVDMDEYTKKIGAGAIHPALYHLYMEDVSSLYLNSGLKIRPWTVNTKEEMEFCFKNNIEAIFTNYPERAVEIRKEIQGF